MSDAFPALVEAKLGAFFEAHGFAADGMVSAGFRETTLFFRSKDARCAVYESIHNGEVNCLLGPPDAPDKLSSGGWKYYRALCGDLEGLSEAELIERVPDRFWSDEEMLDEIAGDLPRAYANLLNPPGG